MNWTYLIKLFYKWAVISYLMLWAFQLNNNQQKFLSILNNNLLTIQSQYLGIQPKLIDLTKYYIQLYYHFLVVIAVSIIFQWKVSKYLTALSVLTNTLMFSIKKQFIFYGIHLVFISVVLKINLKENKIQKQQSKTK